MGHSLTTKERNVKSQLCQSLLPGTIFIISKLYGIAKILLGSNKSYAVQLHSLSSKVTKLGIFLNFYIFKQNLIFKGVLANTDLY